MILLTVTHLPPWSLQVRPGAYSEAVRQQFRGMPGVLWDPTAKAYIGPAEAVTLVLDTLKSAGVAQIRWGLETRDDEWPPLKYSDVAGLRGYQIGGAEWLADKCRAEGAALLADEMGLGKSAQAIVAAETLSPGGIVHIVCPAMVKRHWRTQINQWAGGRHQFTWDVMGYEEFRTAVAKGSAPPANGLILDEVHYLSNPKAQRTKAVTQWLATQSPRPWVIGLSGTPMTSRPRDLHSPLDILHPGRWGKAYTFQARYCNGRKEKIPGPGGTEMEVWVADGVSRPEELAARLRAVMLRRTKAEVAHELPTLSRQIMEIDLPVKARRQLAKAAKASQDLGGSLQGLLSMGEAHKIEAATELARDILANGGRPLLLTTRKETAQTLAKELGCPAVTGEDSADTRRAALLAGGAAGVATIYSVQVGIDLLEFTSIIMVGLDWTPSTLLQAEARLHRLGQQQHVTIHYLIGMGTLDEIVRDRVIAKLDSFAAIVGGGGEGARLATSLGGGDEATLLASLVAAVQQA